MIDCDSKREKTCTDASAAPPGFFGPPPTAPAQLFYCDVYGGPPVAPPAQPELGAVAPLQQAPGPQQQAPQATPTTPHLYDASPTTTTLLMGESMGDEMSCVFTADIKPW